MVLRQLRRPVLACALIAAGAGLGSGCGGDRYILIGTAQAPSTSGFVTVKGKTDHGARLLVHLEQLHRVDSLDPALHAYVVWFEDGNQPSVRAGSLRYRADDRIGELEASSPYRKFVVKVTAEANDTPSAPSGFVVASEQISTLN